MIVSNKFLWMHIGKAAGTTTGSMFYIIKGILDSNIDMNEKGFLKHDNITRRTTNYETKSIYTREHLNSLDKILNIRRLPEYIMSNTQHGIKHNNRVFNKESMINGFVNHSSTKNLNGHVDTILSSYIEEKEPTHWLRTENINEDFVDMIKNYYDIDEKLETRLLKVRVNVNKDYNKNINEFFTEDEIKEMYKNCPLWCEYEEKIYGR